MATYNSTARVGRVADSSQPIGPAEHGVPTGTPAGAGAQKNTPLHSTVSGETVGRQPNYDFATSARNAGRIISRRTSKAEYESLVEEHRILAVKEVDGVLTKSEMRRLVMVRWNIDRIEDAMFGPELDRLEALANSQRQLAEEVKTLVAWVDDQKNRGRVRGRR